MKLEKVLQVELEDIPDREGVCVRLPHNETTLPYYLFKFSHGIIYRIGYIDSRLPVKLTFEDKLVITRLPRDSQCR